MSDCNGHARRNGNGDLLPPQNLEAERGTLGALLIEPSRMAEVRPILAPDDLFRADHQTLYRAMRAVADEGRPCDPILVSDRLAAGGMDQAAADELVAEMMGAVPSVDSAAHYAGIVREKSIRRAIIEVSRVLEREAYTNDHNAATLLRRHAARIEALTPPAPEAPAVAISTIEHVRKIVGDARWLWPDWLIDGHLTVLASDPGIGKTRLAMDLCRRLWTAEPWPDGEMATRPPGTPSLWVPADQNFSQLLDLVRDYGMPDSAVYLNATPDDPCGGLNLDDPRAVAALAARVRAVRPGLLVVDTVNKATRRALYRPEEAEIFFGPLLALARDEAVPILALTHLSKGGDPLDRRIEGTCRVLWKLSAPDPIDATRLRLGVTKSIALRPAVLGVTMGADGNRYDSTPPAPPEDRAMAQDRPQRGRGRPSKMGPMIDWLRAHLADGPALCRTTIEAAQDAGFSKPVLYRAVDALRVICDGPKGNQFFRLPDEVPQNPLDNAPDDDGEDIDWDRERFPD